MKLKDLENVFKNAKTYNADVCIELTLPTRQSSEFTIVLNDNLDYKLEYYKNNYNKNLEMLKNKNIRIVNAFYLIWKR